MFIRASLLREACSPKGVSGGVFLLERMPYIMQWTACLRRMSASDTLPKTSETLVRSAGLASTSSTTCSIGVMPVPPGRGRRPGSGWGQWSGSVVKVRVAARVACYHPDAVVLVRLVFPLEDGALEIERISNF